MNQIGLPIAVFTVYPMENKKKKIKVIIFSSLLSMNTSLTIIIQKHFNTVIHNKVC